MITKRQIEKMYIDKKMPIFQIRTILGVGVAGFKKLLIEHGIEPRASSKMSTTLTDARLISMYVDKEMSVAEIAKSIGIKHTHNLARRLSKLVKMRPCNNVSKSVKKARRKHSTGHEDINGSYWCAVKWGAKNRNIRMNVSIKYAWKVWLKQNGRCAYTNQPLFLVKFRNDQLKGIQEQTASFDRIDSKKGYVRGNVQWIHKDLQHMKHSMSEEKFLDLCRQVYEHRARKDSR